MYGLVSLVQDLLNYTKIGICLFSSEAKISDFRLHID